MNNDLISREALKKHAIWTKVNNGVELIDIEVVPLDVIDNAPTVTPKHGEWIYGEDDCGQDGWFCSECNFFVPWYYQYYEKDVDFIRDYKVCPHCISEMVTYTGKYRDTKGGNGE